MSDLLISLRHSLSLSLCNTLSVSSFFFSTPSLRSLRGNSGSPCQNLGFLYFTSETLKNMDNFGYRMNSLASCEERRMEEPVVCPKPRRLSLLNVSSNDHIRPMKWPMNSNQSEIEDLGVGAELMNIIFSKESYTGRFESHMASSPPFFCGSPPSRASNPVIQDEHFGNKTFNPSSLAPALPSSSSAQGCVQMKFGSKPAVVRIEGFDCLNRDRSNRSISAVA